MNTLTSFVKRFRLDRILVVCLATVVLLITTACNPSSPEVSGKGGDYHEPVAKNTDLYETIQPREGGMNQYSDTDPRRDASRVQRKAENLINRSEENLRKVDSTEDFAENYRRGRPVGERAENVTDRVGEAAENTAEDFAEGAQRGVKNLRRNIGNAADSTADRAERVGDRAQSASRDLSKQAQRTAEDAADAIGDRAQSASRDLSKQAQRTAEDAADAIGDRT